MDVIWNLTRICPWDCAICCVTALHACETTKIYLKRRQKDYGQELGLAEKMQVLKDLCDEGFDIDFSGGDPLYYNEDLQVVEQATMWLPAGKISVSMTGIELTDRKIELLKKVKDVEFTIDSLPNVKNFARPEGYHLGTVLALRQCINAGVRTRAITVLYPLTMKESNLRAVYQLLCELGAPEWELLRFYAVGKAKHLSRLVPSREDYLNTMALLRSFRGPTKIFFQHSLRMLEGNGVCPAVHKSLGILPDGSVSACAWAINTQVQPISEHFMLGKVPEHKIRDIITAAKKRIEFQIEAHESRIITWLDKQRMPKKE
ncbi:MAG: Radical SAM domain protein [Parcubacteria group bacterium GW2011_GWA2_38_13]|nr:MAG: Radical SAM domain protein [Parcubacteria group bacterium GW2011_GWA2_38_13]